LLMCRSMCTERKFSGVAMFSQCRSGLGMANQRRAAPLFHEHAPYASSTSPQLNSAQTSQHCDHLSGVRPRPIDQPILSHTAKWLLAECLIDLPTNAAALSHLPF
jgi:hypothetical protein